MGETVYQIAVEPEDVDMRLDRWLKQQFSDLTQGRIEKLVRTGQIRVNGARTKTGFKLSTGEIVRAPPNIDIITPSKPKVQKIVSDKDADFIRAQIIYQDNDMIALNKPAGLAVQGGTKTQRHIDGMLDALSNNGDKPRLMHRLDRDTSGVLLLARHAQAARRISSWFKARRVQKIYWAIIHGIPNPKAGQIRGWMIKDTGSGEAKEKMRTAQQSEKGSVFAITDYTVVSQAGQRAAFIVLKPETGRTHQLRFHMSQIGCSIIGDRKYTCDRPRLEGLVNGLHLHARALILPKENKSEASQVIMADLSAHMSETFKTLGFDPEEAGPYPDSPF